VPRFVLEFNRKQTIPKTHVFGILISEVEMSAIERTTYPRLPKRRRLKQQELNLGYSVSQDDFKIIKLYANTDKSRLNFAIQLKIFQVLGYFIYLEQVPDEVISHIRQSLKYHYRLSYGYGENNKSLYRHRERIRTHLQTLTRD
jgi:hypothetical protein